VIATTLLTRESENQKSLMPHPANTNDSLSVSSCCRPYNCLPKIFLYVTLPPPLSEAESWSKVNHLKYLDVQFFFHPMRVLKPFVLQTLTVLTSSGEIFWITNRISFLLVSYSARLFLKSRFISRSGVVLWFLILACWHHRRNLTSTTVGGGGKFDYRY